MPETPEMIKREAVNAMRQLTATTGWSRMTERIDELIKMETRAILNPRTLPDEASRQEHSFRKGRLDALKEVLNMPRALEVKAAEGD